MSLTEIESMNQKESDEFTRCCAYIMAKTYVPRDTPEMTVSKEYAFIQRKFSLFEEYLALSGWRIYYDKTLAVIYVRNIEGFNKVRLDKLTTLIIITMRLIFEEKRMDGGTLNAGLITVGELLAKMINEFSLLPRKPNNKELKDSLRILEQHNIIYKMSENYEDMECKIKILPSIAAAIPNDRCRMVYEKLRAEEEENSDENNDKSTAD
ncbi:MAG: DUF4194 domain-containing protein [Ruminococcaceae bacterium]|nr:DUF4194 domain-containing protein [Oscillospiraceae bacterium]